MEIRSAQKILETLSEKDLPLPVYPLTGKKWKGAWEGRVPLQLMPAAAVSGLGRAELDELAARGAGAATVLTIGDGETATAGRYVAWKLGAKLSVVPVVLAGEALVRSEVWVLEQGRREALGEKAPDLILGDGELIWSGPEEESRGAVGDILAIVTALEDWKKAPPESLPAFDEALAERALDIVRELLDRADEIYELSVAGIQKLLELLAQREELATRAGSRRPVEGSERVLRDAAPVLLGRPVSPGGLACLAVVLMSELQGKTSRPLKQFLSWVQAAWKPTALGISDAELEKVLSALPGFARQHGYPPTVLDRVELTAEKIQELLSSIREPLIKSSFQDRRD